MKEKKQKLNSLTIKYYNLFLGIFILQVMMDLKILFFINQYLIR